MEREFPGAAQVIKRLSQEPRQVVLEAQGNPYSFTTHVASLSGHDAYLGWSNHVQLLTKKYDEVRRRTEETERLYRDKDCETKRLIAEREQISFIVLGPLETQAYPDASSEHFDCFNKLIKAQRYEVYSLHSSENS